MARRFVNASPRSAELVGALGRADPPLYAAFFVLAGAELKPDALSGIGAIGLLFVALRVAGKTIGAYVAAARTTLSIAVRRHLGLCLVSSSSLAIGLTIQVREQFPAAAERVTGIVLAAVIVFEVVGPLLTRLALIRTGEARTAPAGSLRRRAGDDPAPARDTSPPPIV